MKRRASSASRRAGQASAGFTLLETVIALAILGLALMAIFDMNSGAVSNHAYTKRLTVATLLARSKMTDIEQELYDKGFSAEDDELSGDFSEEGWPSFKWRAKIIAPDTDNVPPEQLVAAVFNIPMGEGGIGGLFGLGQAAADKAAEKGMPAMGGAAAAAMGPFAGFAQQQLTQMIEEIGKGVREVHLTVSWKDGKIVESIDLVTHVVSLGLGSDRNGAVGPGGTIPAQGAGGWMNPRTQQPVPNPVPCRGNPQTMCDPMDQVTQLVPMPAQGQLGGGVQGGQLGGGNPALIPPQVLENNQGILRNPMVRPGMRGGGLE